MKVAVVVPVWNQARLLQRLLESIAQQTHKPDEVIIVDNGSSDGASDVAAQWGARVIALGENHGFAVAVNRGIAACSTDWIALINSDVVLRPDWLEKLSDAARETNASFVCGKLLMDTDHARLDGCWDLIATSGFPLRAGNGHLDSLVFGVRRSISLASATATLYRRDLFSTVGGFDERYESYLEDVDFSIRCAVQGFTGTYEPNAIAVHLGGGSHGRMIRLYSRNQIILVRKLFPVTLQRKFRRRIVWGRLLWGVLSLRRGTFLDWVAGVADARKIAVEALPLDLRKLERLLGQWESEIRSLAGPDLYWRLYFLFTRGESR